MNFYKLIIASFFILLCAQQGIISGQLDNRDAHIEMCDAIWKSNVKTVLDLLNKGVSVNSEMTCEDTFLGLAVVTNNLDLAELFLSRGANPNLKGGSGSSLPLCYAIGNKNFEMVQLLLKYKADASYKSGYDSSPVEFAQGILGYPSYGDRCHPIVGLLLKSIEK